MARFIRGDEKEFARISGVGEKKSSTSSALLFSVKCDALQTSARQFSRTIRSVNPLRPCRAVHASNDTRA